MTDTSGCLRTVRSGDGGAGGADSRIRAASAAAIRATRTAIRRAALEYEALPVAAGGTADTVLRQSGHHCRLRSAPQTQPHCSISPSGGRGNSARPSAEESAGAGSSIELRSSPIGLTGSAGEVFNGWYALGYRPAAALEEVIRFGALDEAAP